MPSPSLTPIIYCSTTSLGGTHSSTAETFAEFYHTFWRMPDIIRNALLALLHNRLYVYTTPDANAVMVFTTSDPIALRKQLQTFLALNNLALPNPIITILQDILIS